MQSGSIASLLGSPKDLASYNFKIFSSIEILRNYASFYAPA
jgi:hypothetical protein